MSMNAQNNRLLLAVILTLSSLPCYTSAQLMSESLRTESLLAVVADAQELPLVSLEDLPWHGTYWTVRNTVPCVQAPLPFPPLDPSARVYSIGSSHFLVDMTDEPLFLRGVIRTSLSMADSALLVQKQADDLTTHIASIQQAEVSTQLSAMTSEALPPFPGGGGGGGIEEPSTNFPPAYSLGLGLCLFPPVISSSSITINLTNTPNSGWLTNSYDLFYTTNMASLSSPALCLTNWAWLTRSTPGDTNFVLSNSLFSECYFRLGTMQDSDGDGLTDAYEMLVSHTNPAVGDSDGDGLSDGWELGNGMSPLWNESAQTTGRRNYQYDGSGWLRTVSGVSGEAITLDNEGNVLTSQ